MVQTKYEKTGCGLFIFNFGFGTNKATLLIVEAHNHDVGLFVVLGVEDVVLLLFG